MHIDEAILKVLSGKKVRHRSWHRDNFLELDSEKNVIIFYDWQYASFQVSPDMLTSGGWYNIENPSEKFFFARAINLLHAGKKIAHQNDDSYEFLEMNIIEQTIYKRILVEKEFIIDHKALFSNEWEEVK